MFIIISAGAKNVCGFIKKLGIIYLISVLFNFLMINLLVSNLLDITTNLVLISMLNNVYTDNCFLRLKLCFFIIMFLLFLETCLLTREKHLATVQAQTICQVFSLSADSFYKVLEEYPEAFQDMKRTTKEAIHFN